MRIAASEAVFDGIGSARQLDPDGIVDTFAGVILDEAPTQAARLDANQRVGLRVEISWTAEHLDADRIALEPRTAAGQRLLHNEAQKIGSPSGLLKTAARKNSLQRDANFARARLTATAVEILSGGVIAACFVIGHRSATPFPIAAEHTITAVVFALYELKDQA